MLWLVAYSPCLSVSVSVYSYMAVDGFLLSQILNTKRFPPRKRTLHCEQYEPFTLSRTRRGLKHALESVAEPVEVGGSLHCT